ncbi:MAG: hypothetical protein AAFX79_09895 [Planctomycetota bacterium]
MTVRPLPAAPAAWPVAPMLAGVLTPAAISAVLIVADVALIWSFNTMGLLILLGIAGCFLRPAHTLPSRAASIMAGASIPIAEAHYYRGDAGPMLLQISWAMLLFCGVALALKPTPIARLTKTRGAWGPLVFDLTTGGVAIVLFNLSMLAEKTLRG